jgi:hypothetical protein
MAIRLSWKEQWNIQETANINLMGGFGWGAMNKQPACSTRPTIRRSGRGQGAPALNYAISAFVAMRNMGQSSAREVKVWRVRIKKAVSVELMASWFVTEI